MKKAFKTIITALASALSICCLSLQSFAYDYSETGIEQGKIEGKLYSENISKDFDDEKFSGYVSSLVELIDETENISGLIESIEALGDDMEISDVQVYDSVSNLAKGNRVYDGYASEGIVVKVFYDNGKSWIEHKKMTKSSALDSSKESKSERNLHGFILPLSDMNLHTHINCLFYCSPYSGCIKCQLDGSGTWRNNQHNGIDVSWSGINGTNILAVRAGTVTKGYSATGWGYWVKIAHNNGLSTLYAHMQNESSVSGTVKQGAIIGKVGTTGASSGPHLHFEVYNSSNVRIDPMPYLHGVNPAATKSFKIVDGPLTIRASASTSSTSYGTLTNGTSVSITNIQVEGSYIFGKISSGTHSGRWIAIGTIAGEVYATDLSSTWMVIDGPLTIRGSASTSSTSYGTIANGTTFTISDTALSGNYILGKISSGTHNGRWVALGNGSSRYCMTPNY